MNWHDYLIVVRRRWLSILVVTLAVLALAAVFNLAVTPTYTATTRLFFGVQGGQSVSDLAQGSTFTEKQMSSYAQVATSPLVLQKVVDDLQLDVTADDLAGQVTAVNPLDTVILEISVNDADAATSAQITNAIAKQLVSVVGTLTPAQPDGSEPVRATVLAAANAPAAPSSPAVARNLVLALLGGVIAGFAVALARQLLDTKVRSEQDVRAVTESAILGTIAFDEHVPQHPVVIADDPHSQAAEAIRRLRTNLQFIGNDSECKTVVITSSIPGEGKSTTSINLAASMADTGARVILVDADLRRPSIANYTGLEGRAGLTSILIGRADLEDVVQPWRDTTLTVLPSGPVPPNPSELLGSAKMSELLAQLAAGYDVVLIDTPPLLPVTDATILTKMVGGALVVVGADRLHRAQLVESLASLETAGARVYGMVVNKVARRDSSNHGYGYGYGYASYAPESTPVADPEAEAPVPAATIAGRSDDLPALSGRNHD
jgi:capsular exopolysaccharide synthesis family protein